MIERLGMVGVSWRQSGSSEALAEFTLGEDVRVPRLRAFAESLEFSGLAYLATCNRVELVFARGDRTPAGDLRGAAFELLTGRTAAAGEAEHRLRAWQGEGAAEHLFLVAAGLDSAYVGENEIAGQVRECHERAVQLGLCGPSLSLVFEEALHTAARVRQETKLGEGHVSLAEIAIELLRERVARTGGTVALIGVSAMTQRAAVSLADAGVSVTFVNRSADKAAALAARFGGRHASLPDFRRGMHPVEAVLSATGAPHAVLEKTALERLSAAAPSGQPPLVVDMAVPADVDPDACTRLAIPRVGMDDIVRRAEENRAARLAAAAPARELVDEALTQLHERFTKHYYGPLFGALQQRYMRTAREGIERLLRKELKGLGAEQRVALEMWSETLARRFAHIPSRGLRGILNDGPEGSLEAFLGGLEPKFAEELRAALRERHGDGDGRERAGGGNGRWHRPLRLGTRGSALALTQSSAVAERLRASGHQVELAVITTAGDRDVASPFGSIGPQGVFVREIERALLAGEVDLAVHSFKDLPTASPPELQIAAVPPRLDPADVLLARADALRKNGHWLPLIRGARVGTASARRRAWLTHHRSDLAIEPLRGNVPTRIRKLTNGYVDAIVLAAAGIDRLRAGDDPLADALQRVCVVRLDPKRFVPAPAQGALAVQCRRDDEFVRDALAALDDPASHAAIAAERDALARAEGGCDIAFGAYCRPEGEMYELIAMLEHEGEILAARARGVDQSTLAAQLWPDLLDLRTARHAGAAW